MAKKLSTIGLLHAIGVISYCALIGIFLWMAEEYLPTPPGYLGTILILVLLVFSAATTGAIVFGYSAYLGLQNRIKDALTVFAYTLLYCLTFIIIAVLILGISKRIV